MIVCKECQSSYEIEKSFHSHLRKHGLNKKSYYEKHYPKFCLQTNKKIQWKDSDDLKSYLNRDFIDKIAMYQFFESKECIEDKKNQLIKMLDESYAKHGILPSQSELVSLPCSPNLLTVQNFFVLKDLIKSKEYLSRFDYGFNYDYNLPLVKVNPDDFTILIDSREQRPYRFFSSVVGKINEGDYALAGQLYNNISIERKSISDFGGTVVGGNDRFRRELDRVRENGRYLIILVEFNLHDLHKHKFFGYANSALVGHSMRNIFREYSDVCQIVFGGDRDSCVKYVIEFLLCGQKCRNIDLQLYVDSHKNKFKNFEFTKQDLLELYDNS